MEQENNFGIPGIRAQTENLLPFISKDYLNTRSGWIFIGQCLYNMFDERGKDIWIRYTSQQFRDFIDEIWNTYENTRHGIAAIRLLAKEGNSVEFNKWMKEVVMAAALGAVQETAGITEIADIAKFLFGDNFICTNTETRTWVVFEGQHWKTLSGGSKLRQKFSRELVTLFEKLMLVLLPNQAPPEAKESFKEMRGKCVGIIRGLKEPGYKSKVMQECAEICYEPDFEDLADEDPHLLGLPNGVFDFKHWIHRRGFPEDWITLQMAVPYDDRFSWEHPEVKEVMLFFRKVLYHDELINFVLGHKSTCLVGGNLDKWLVIYIGETAHNAKTTIEKFDKLVFGKYCGKFPLGTVVGQTPNAGAADPATATSKGQRLKFVDEANQTQKFNFSFVKTATGNDTVYARKLYSNGKEFTPQYTLIMILNQPPEAKTSDAAIWERMVLVPFDSRFTSSPPASEEEQWAKRTFKADPFIETKLKQLASAYFWILVEYYRKYLKEGGLKKPAAVIEKSRKYKYENDMFAQFIDNKIEKTERHLDYICLNDFYINFKLWHTDSYPKSHTPSKTEFEKELIRLLGQPSSPDSRWHGVKLKSAVQRFNRTE